MYLLKILPEEHIPEVKDFLGKMDGTVKALFFSRRAGCTGCVEAEALLDDLSSLSDNLVVEKYFHEEHSDVFKLHNVSLLPSIILESEHIKGSVRFLGVPLGYEFASLLEDLIGASKGSFDLPKSLVEDIVKVEKDLHIQVFITLSCPYCPIAVKVAHSFAMVNSHITADMIDASLFPELSMKYYVSAVPKTIINDAAEILGAFPPKVLFEKIRELL